RLAAQGAFAGLLVVRQGRAVGLEDVEVAAVAGEGARGGGRAEEHPHGGGVGEFDRPVRAGLDQDAGREVVENGAELVTLLLGPPAGVPDLAVEVSPVDRGGGVGGENLESAEVALVERLSVESLGEIEVAQGAAGEEDGHAKQR